MNWFYQSIDYADSEKWYDIICKAFIKRYDLSLREISRYVDAAKRVAPQKQSSIFYPSSTELAKMTVLPIMIGVKVLNASLYESFIGGQNSKPLIEVAKSIPERCFQFLLQNDEVFEEEKNANKTSKVVKLEDRLNEYYRVLFTSEGVKSRYGIIQIGNIEIEADTTEALKHAASGLEFPREENGRGE